MHKERKVIIENDKKAGQDGTACGSTHSAPRSFGFPSVGNPAAQWNGPQRGKKEAGNNQRGQSDADFKSENQGGNHPEKVAHEHSHEHSPTQVKPYEGRGLEDSDKTLPEVFSRLRLRRCRVVLHVERNEGKDNARDGKNEKWRSPSPGLGTITAGNQADYEADKYEHVENSKLGSSLRGRIGCANKGSPGGAYPASPTPTIIMAIRTV